MKIYPVSYDVLAKVFEAAGCKYIRTKGDHLVYQCPNSYRPVVIPKYKEVPVFVIKNNLRTIGMSREEYLELLKKM